MDGYPMRKAARELSEQETAQVFDEAEYCVISTTDADGAPYGVPISYAMADGKLYVHTTADYGHKFDDWERDGRVCVTAVTAVKPFFTGGEFSTEFASAIATGVIRRVDDDLTKRRALVALCMKYLPEHKADIGAAMDRALSITAIWEVAFNEVRGKANRRK